MLPIQPTQCTGIFLKKTDALVGIRAPSSLPFPAGYLLRGSFVNVRMLLPAPVVFALFVLSSASRVPNTHGQLLYVATPLLRAFVHPLHAEVHIAAFGLDSLCRGKVFSSPSSVSRDLFPIQQFCFSAYQYPSGEIL